MRMALAFIMNGLFAVELHVSNMENTPKLLGLFGLFAAWDLTLMVMMCGTITPMQVTGHPRGNAPLIRSSSPTRCEQRLGHRLILGAVMFGVGLGIVGICPGPAFASLGYGEASLIVSFVVRVFGTLLAPHAFAVLDSLAQRA